MAAVGVVTDSTACLDPESATRAGLRVVALQVVIDGISRPEDGTGATLSAVSRALRSGAAVSTSRPSPEAFAQAYAAAAEAGAGSVVSVHLSSQISGTADAARTAAGRAPLPVTVVDTATAAMGVGFAALAAASAANQARDVTAVAAAAQAVAAQTSAWFCVASLEHLRRGGRIGTARALLGSALAIKPILTVTAGQVNPYERVRTAVRASARMTELAVAAVGDLLDRGVDGVGVAVHHVDDPAGAARFATQLGEQLTTAGVSVPVVISALSAVLAVHTGPGTLGVIVGPLTDPRSFSTG